LYPSAAAVSLVGRNVVKKNTKGSQKVLPKARPPVEKKRSKASQKARPKTRTPIDLEVEVKIRCDSVDRLLTSNLIVELDEDRHLEDNYVFPLPDGKLRNGQYLRIRHTGDGEGSGRRRAGLLTYKGKPKRVAGSDGGKNKGKKVREEIETSVGQPPKLVKILKRLGLRRSFRYQKYRTIYLATLPDGRSLNIMFDETPIGNFLELEGDASVIEAAAEALGYGQKQFVADSYVDMHIARCSNRGEPMSDMLFEETKVRQAKKRARRKQGDSKGADKGKTAPEAKAETTPAKAKKRARASSAERTKRKASKQKARVEGPKKEPAAGRRAKSGSKKGEAAKASPKKAAEANGRAPKSAPASAAPKAPRAPAIRKGNGASIAGKKAVHEVPEATPAAAPPPVARVRARAAGS
jgi:adenylate cyclase, class 2